MLPSDNIQVCLVLMSNINIQKVEFQTDYQNKITE